MKALHSWLLTEGAHGMISQVEGLARGLNTTFDHKKVRLPFFSKFLPPLITPKNKVFFNFKELIQKIDHVPDFIISCGRKSVIPNIVLKKYFKEKYNKEIQNIHIQDPKVSSNYFNFIITPEHDNPVNGNNVLTSKGALHYLSEEEIKNSNLNNEKVVSLVLGGPNKYYNFSFKDLEIVFTQLSKDKSISKINIIASRRTPLDLFERPATKFVATFIGSPSMNMIKASIIKHNDQLSMKTNDGIIVPVPKDKQNSVSEGQNISFGFRAEDIVPLKFGQKPSSAWEMQSSVNLAEPLGTETLIFTNFGEIEIVSRMFTPEQVKSNDVLDFALNLDRTYLFDENSGLAI